MKNGSYLFPPANIFRRVNREWLINLAGGRALLLELAHPLVAAGVAQHSQFQQYPLRRLWRTWTVMTQIIFGKQAEQRRALEAFHGCHVQVHGRLPRAEGQYPAGRTYDAHDPELKLWVLATLIDSALVAYESLVTPLHCEEREEYYEESKRVAERLGIPACIMPKGYNEFEKYMKSMIASERLHVGEHARHVVAALLAARRLRPLTKIAHFFGVGFLPERLRTEYRFIWTGAEEERFRCIVAGIRRFRASWPNILFVNPHAQLSD